jgi:hypothetical protein
MLPANYDITLYKGDTYSLPLTFKDSLGVAIDISTWTFKGQIKVSSRDTLPQTEFAFQITDGPGGKVTASLTHAQTEVLKSGVYDIQIASGNVVQTYLYGKIKITGEVTTS